MDSRAKTEIQVPGIAASQGIAYGQIFVYLQSDVEVPSYQVEAEKRIDEVARFDRALVVTRQQVSKIKNEVEKNIGPEEAAIFDAHLMVLEDEALIGETIRDRVSGGTIEAHETSSREGKSAALAGVQVVFAAGAAGVQFLSKAEWSQAGTLKAIVDLNAVPPAGLEGVDLHDHGVERNGVACYGALGVGGLGLATVYSIAKKHGPVNMVHFDAHLDTYPAAWGQEYHHGAFMRHAIDEGLVNPKRTLQVGIRGPLAAGSDLDFVNVQGVTVTTIDDVRIGGLEAFLERLPSFAELMMVVRMLLNSWAMLEASSPTLLSRCAWSSC